MSQGGIRRDQAKVIMHHGSVASGRVRWSAPGGKGPPRRSARAFCPDAVVQRFPGAQPRGRVAPCRRRKARPAIRSSVPARFRRSRTWRQCRLRRVGVTGPIGTVTFPARPGDGDGSLRAARPSHCGPESSRHTPDERRAAAAGSHAGVTRQTGFVTLPDEWRGRVTRRASDEAWRRRHEPRRDAAAPWRRARRRATAVA